VRKIRSAYLAVTTEITSLPQLTPEELGETVTSRALAAAAYMSREHCMHLAQPVLKPPGPARSELSVMCRGFSGTPL
jgi:hypothetical protein